VATFVLIHGAWHSSWCWEKVVSPLENLGHKVITVDLPGSKPDDKTPLEEITLKSYTDHVVKIVKEQDEKVILVGHSLGGLIISQTAEYIPDKIKGLVYLTAFLLRNGENMNQYTESDKESIASLEFIEEGKGVLVQLDNIFEAFYHNCDPEEIKNVISRLVPQSRQVLMTPLEITEQNYGSIPRIFVKCTQDRGLTVNTQERMLAAMPCQKIYTISTDHSPFYSKPAETVEILNAVVKDFT
jgi:pimeloyl-ACP methyl ester carboxylesterase